MKIYLKGNPGWGGYAIRQNVTPLILYVLQIYKKRVGKGYVEIKKMRFPGVKDAKRPFRGLFILSKNAIFSLCIFIRFEMALQKFNFWRAKVPLLGAKSGTFRTQKWHFWKPKVNTLITRCLCLCINIHHLHKYTVCGGGLYQTQIGHCHV